MDDGADGGARGPTLLDAGEQFGNGGLEISRKEYKRQKVAEGLNNTLRHFL
jgi:hypothetical protein